MASTPSKAKKARTKPPRGRPAATSAISQPAVVDTSSLTYLSTFSPRGDLFAFLSLAVDKHRLRVYDTATRQSVAEHIIDTARVTSACWYEPPEMHASLESDDETASQPKKKRKPRHPKSAKTASASNSLPQAVVLGLSDGSLTFFSPTHGRIVRTLSHPASTADILSVAVGQRESFLWTSSADGTIRVWDAFSGEVVDSWNSDDRLYYSCLAPRPFAEENGQADVLVARHAITLLSVSSNSSEAQFSGKQKLRETARFTGHASPVKSLNWSDSSRFLSTAEADRFVYVWDVPEKPSLEGKIAASIPLDSDARSISLSVSSNATQRLERDLLAVSASGKISIFPLHSNLALQSQENSKQKIPTLIPRSNISVSTKKDAAPVQIVAATFLGGEEGRIRVARLANGIQPVFDVVTYFDESSDYIPEIVISDSGAGFTHGTGEPSGASQKRYNESSSLAVRSGVELGQDPSMDDLPMRDVDGDLDVDLAELSLGQRLTALTGGTGLPGHTSSDSEDDASPSGPSRQRKREDVPEAVPASSLTRTLIQALHSSDARLLETCLAHSNPTLIRNTVRRLPAQLAVPLITACVERLGRGARAANMKGGGGGASSQRGAALINWVKAVLVAHSGHLMTMPDLVARLAGLHTTLTTRLTLQDSLLALSGRLDMVISQIEMRASGPPAPLPQPKGKGKQPRKREARRYVEGESEDEEERMEVEVESGDEGGSVEYVELGGASEEDEDESEDEEDVSDEEGDGDGDEDEDEDGEDDDDDDGGGGLKVNGFIDDEAEEYSEDEDDSASE